MQRAIWDSLLEFAADEQWLAGGLFGSTGLGDFVPFPRILRVEVAYFDHYVWLLDYFRIFLKALLLEYEFLQINRYSIDGIISHYG